MSFYKKKSLGQHFLRDTNIALKIVKLAGDLSKDSVIEIGPGAGALSSHIVLQEYQRFIMVELDVRACEILKKQYPNLELINADASTIDFSKLIKNKAEQFIVIANLPYNVSARILENIIANRAVIKKMVLMFQKELAERILASPGGPEYGRLTLLAQEFYTAKKVLDLKPSAFNPPPKVDSSVLVFERRAEPLFDVLDRKLYDSLISCVFSNRRKMLRRSLKGILSEEKLLYLATYMDLSKRPQELEPSEFANLVKLIKNS